jgi:hypothetical protein
MGYDKIPAYLRGRYICVMHHGPQSLEICLDHMNNINQNMLLTLDIEGSHITS